MLASLRIPLVVALLVPGIFFAFAAGYARAGASIPANAVVISTGHGHGINVLTGSYVAR